jgi:phosphoesterase RecJ-like protein
MGLLFKELSDNLVKVSVRSQNGYDSLGLAIKFGGGGHTNAAGFTQDGKLDTVVKNVIEQAVEYIGEIN